ncbi:DMT family transporter [Undibacterium pigrum]|uniref:Threonine/homoserine efflux transporter RhtA n=1 Tax=Undibacterium pigrum TaxID=401470 RepID=A0A318IZW7_9BURK|nr:DMT family transporter [Undibacterium pigrum]PXX37218.1 threonine/homoserine efflux transporter RhtA [Undibacterium pigrum]
MSAPSAAIPYNRKATLAYIAAMLMLATLGIFIHEAGLDAITTVFFRCLFAAIALALYCAWKGMFVAANFSCKNLGLAVFGGVLMVVNWVTFFAAIQRIGISVTTIVFHVQPFIVLLLGAVLFREKIAANKLAWICLGFIGLVLACGLKTGGMQMSEQYLLGLLLTLTGACAYAGVTLTTRAMRNMPAHLIALIHCLAGLVLLAALITIPADGIRVQQWAWLVGLGLIPTALAYVLIYGALPKMPTPAIAVLTFIYPAMALGMDYLVYGQRISLLQMAGLVLIVLASLGVNLDWSWRPASQKTA